MPPNIDPSTISYIGGLLSVPVAFFAPNSPTTARSPNNGEGVILRGTPGSDGSGEGWSILETVLIRFNTGYTLYGRFPVYLKRNSTHDPWVGTTFGYDAAVCVRKYEPWIIETYNTSIGSPSVVRIIGRGDGSAPLSPGGNIQGDPITGTRYLNTSNKGTVFELAHGNSINHVMKDNGRDGYYLPSPTVGPIVPPPGCNIPSNFDLLLRPFLSPAALDLGGIPNSPPTGSPLPLHKSPRLTLYHTSRARDSLLLKFMRTRRWHMLFTHGGN